MKNINLVRDESFSAYFSGKLVNKFNGNPIDGAVVNLGDSNTISDSKGFFEFIDIPKGELVLRVSAIGFHDKQEEVAVDSFTGEIKEVPLTPYGRITFTSSRDGRKNIYSINYDGTGLKNITESYEGDCWGGVASPDGGKLVFYSNMDEELDMWGQKLTNLYVANSDGVDAKRITLSVIPEDYFRITQDSERVFFVAKSKLSDKKEIYISSIGRREEWIQLTDNDFTETNLDVSPNGDKVVFGGFEEGFYNFYTMDIEDREMKKLFSSPNPLGYVSFSPNGESILYTKETYDFSTKLVLYDLKSGEEDEIYRSSSGIKNITWDKEGEKIAFSSERDDKNDIYTLDIDSEKEVKLTDESKGYTRILWPPVEKIMIFVIHTNEGNKLSVMDLSKREIKVIEDIFDDTISWQAESFDTK